MEKHWVAIKPKTTKAKNNRAMAFQQKAHQRVRHQRLSRKLDLNGRKRYPKWRVSASLSAFAVKFTNGIPAS